MGAPELPNDPGDDALQPQVHHIQHAPIPSDDSDNESTDAYEGYQPLAMMENAEDSSEMDYVENDNMSVAVDNDANAIVLSDINLPIEDIADDEIAHRWNEPRPQELQIELDSFRTEEILNAMANVSLPNTSVPDWARGVPEEHWKNELLQRIRQRNNV